MFGGSCCDKCGGGEDAGQPGSLSTQFRATLTTTQVLLSGHLYISGGSASLQRKDSQGSEAHQTLLPVEKVTDVRTSCLPHNDARRGGTWWEQKVGSLWPGGGAWLPTGSASGQHTPNVSGLQFLNRLLPLPILCSSEDQLPAGWPIQCQESSLPRDGSHSTWSAPTPRGLWADFLLQGSTARSD